LSKRLHVECKRFLIASFLGEKSRLHIATALMSLGLRCSDPQQQGGAPRAE
jgi:hypothetical protein